MIKKLVILTTVETERAPFLQFVASVDMTDTVS
jgi:hypothetical protein